MQNISLSAGTTKKAFNQVVSSGTPRHFLSWVKVNGLTIGEFRIVIGFHFCKVLQSAGWWTQLRRSARS